MPSMTLGSRLLASPIRGASTCSCASSRSPEGGCLGRQTGFLLTSNGFLGLSTKSRYRTLVARSSMLLRTPLPGAHPSALQTLHYLPSGCPRRSSSLELHVPNNGHEPSPGHLQP